jgi:transcriptional regulator with XRE-family HTH domain
MDAATLLVRCRARAGLSQRELGRRAGTSAAAVCLYERGARLPRVDTLTRLIAATGSTLDLAIAPPARLDVEANARTLEDLLELSDHLPQHSDLDLAMPPFASLAFGTRADT